MKKKQLNRVLSLKKETVADLSLCDQKEARGGAKTTDIPVTAPDTGPCGPTYNEVWTCYYPTFCYPSPYTDCSPTNCGIPC